MKVDRSKLKKSTSEVPADCKALIEKLKSCSELHAELQQHKTWNHGKCELYHWVDVLDRFDSILDEGCKAEPNTLWHLACDHPNNTKLKHTIHSVLNFTALLIEHSFSRHLYNSIEKLTTLLSSSDMSTVLAVLNLVYVFSKRSNFLIKLGGEKRQELFNRLTFLAESWGGKDNGFGLAECCVNEPNPKFPASATTLHFEFYSESGSEDKAASSTKKNVPHIVTVIHVENVDKMANSPADVMEDLLRNYSIPKEKMTLLFTHIRLAHCFSHHEKRLQCVQARLQALSVLVYSSAIQEVSNSLLYNGLIEELVDVLQLQDSVLVDIKAASLRTLTSIIHLDRNPKLVSIIDATGAASYHGFLPVLVRQCIQTMIDPAVAAFPHPLATALFSFLYHLASYETGGEALVSSGMMESLLKVIKWPGEDEQIHTTFVTRAVRVVDLITNLDMAAFQTHQGLSTFVNRLEHEVCICRQEVPFVLRPAISNREGSMSPSHYSDDASAMDTDEAGPSHSREPVIDEEDEGNEEANKDKKKKSDSIQCFPQRAALLKSMLNFLKKAIPDPSFSDSIRHVMDGSLPRSLKHVISNAEYYGPSLFLLACELVTVYVFQEPSLLSSLQDTGLTDVMLHALLIKDVPATKEVLGSLPNIFSALCLNARGLQAFVQCKPFDKLFKVLLSPTYLPAMRRRRGTGSIGDTASSLGSAMDELMRHQPSLKADAMKAIIKLLEEINILGRDPKYICSRQPSKSKSPASGVSGAASSSQTDTADDNNTSSDDEGEDEDEVASTVSQTSTSKAEAEAQQQSGAEVKTPVPLLDYILNVMKFVEAILSNNATDDHCREFVNQDGLTPLMGVLGLPNLPIDFPSSPACQSVASVCKSVLSLAHEPKVLKQGLVCLRAILVSLEPLHHPMDEPGGSILLKELVNAPNINEAPQSSQATPLLHSMASAHAYVTQFVHVCRVGQSDVRTISINQWGSPLGQLVLHGLSKLYTSLVWESIVLLALFTPGSLPDGCELGKAEKDKLLPKETPMEETSSATAAGKSSSSKIDEGDSTSRTESQQASDRDLIASATTLMDVGDALSPMEVDDVKGDSSQGGKSKSKISPQMLQQLKQAMPVLYAPSRLGKALSELFGLLVKLCVGSSVRQRSRHNLQPNLSVPSEAARNTAKALTDLLATSLSWTPPPACPLPKFRLTFYICAVSFASPMLFDEKKNPYHLMLQKFVASGGHSALFEAFDWSLSMGGKVSMKEGLQHPELPEGTGEFLDAWLVLVEKMVNPEAVLESPHCLPAKANNSPGFVPFSPAQFLINTHKAAFNAILNLWECKPLAVYGNRMSESILAILCHILRGESVVKDKLEKEKTEAADGTASGSGTAASVAGSSSISAAAVLGGARFPGESALFGSSGLLSQRIARPVPNEEHITQLMDMGFPRDHAIEALQQTGTLEQAAEWALTHPPRISQDFGTGLTEEEEMMRAIAMSLGEALQPTPDEQAKEEEKKKKEEEEKARKEKEELQKQAAAKERIPEEPPLDKEVLDGFVDSMLPGCLKLLDDIPDTVYRICDLLIVANNRSGNKWRDKMLEMLIMQIADHATQLLQTASVNSSDVAETKEAAEKLSTSADAAKLAPRIHLFCLLFEEMKSACAKTVESCNLRDVLVKLLVASQQCLCAVKDTPTPKWLAPMLLLIDLYEKAAVTARRKLAHKGASHVWKWFDDSTGRWCQYSNNNNKTIDDAYWAGRTSVRFTAARRRYVVHFNTMVQINEETLNRRPIMQSLPVTDKDINNKAESNKRLKTSNSSQNVEGAPAAGASVSTPQPPGATTAGPSTDKKETPKEPPIVPVEGLSADHITAIIRACVGLISIPVEPDTLHAVMRTCLRFTRDHRNALLFAELGGPQMLLHLSSASAFNGFPFLATLLLRHVFEERSILKHAMEKVISSTANRGVGSAMCGVTSGSMGARELNYVLRVLGPTACRDEQLFVDSAKALLKIALPVPKRGEDDDSRYTGPNALQLLKAVPLKFFTPPPIEGVMKQVLCDLLNALVVPNDPKPAESNQVATISEQKEPSETVPSISDATTDPITAMDSSDTPSTAAAAAPSQPTDVMPPSSGDTSPAVASEEIGMGLREIGDELLRFYTPGQEGATGSNVRPATQRLDSGADATSAAEDEAHDSSSPSTSGAMASQTKKQPDSSGIAKKATSKQTKEEAAKAKPLVPKSAILRLVAELIRSYTGYALVVAQYQYAAGQTEYIREDGPVLAYILDHLLPQCQAGGDKDCPALAQVLLASLAASNHSHEAQTILVAEVKAALARALALPESAEKHARVQSLTLLIGVIIEACPPAGSSQHPSGTYKQPQPTTMNNIVRIMLRKGLVTDLARVPHSLDLSSPNMATTINSALKPLETLSRVVNQPMPSYGKGLGKGKTLVTRSNGQSMANNTATVRGNRGGSGVQSSTGGATSATGSASVLLNASGLSQAMLGVETSQSGNSQAGSQDPTAMDQRTELDDIMDELLERTTPTVLGETLIATGPERLGSLGPGYLDQTGDASQDEMVITMTDEGEEMEQGIGDAEMNSHHSNEDAGDDGDEESVHDDDDSAADSESDDDSEDQQDDAEEEDEDEEEEEEEHEEGSDMDADEYDYYDNLGESYFRVPDRDEDLFIQLEDVFPASIRTYQLPVAVHDDAGNSNDATAPSIPAAPGAVSTTHPLLIRHADHTNLTHGYGHTIRSHRGRTARGHRHGAGGAGGGGAGGQAGGSNTQTVHIYHSGGNRTPSVPTILRLLGLTSAADLVQITGGGGGGGATSNAAHGASNQTRVFVTDSVEDHIFGQNYDSIYNDMYQDNFNDGWVSATDPISSVPSAYSRWAEEARVLDGGSVYDCIQALKPDVIEVLEKQRNEELADRREKRKKQAEEDAKKAAAEEAKKKLTEEAKKKAEEAKKAAAAATAESKTEAAGGTSSNSEGVSDETGKDKEEMMEVVEGSQRPTVQPPVATSTPTNAGSATPTAATSAAPPFYNYTELAASVSAAAMESLAPAGTPTSSTSAAMATSVAETSTPNTTPAIPATPTSPATGLAAAIASIVASPPVSSTDALTSQQAMQMSSTPVVTQSSTTTATAQTPDMSSTAPTSMQQSGPAITTPSEQGGLAGFTTPALRAFSEANPTFASLLAQDLSEVGLQSSPASSNQEAAAATTAASGGADSTLSEPNANIQSISSLNNINLPGQSTPGPSTTEAPTPGVQLPEGVDPSFLAALPENIRQEVLREHLGIRNTQTPPASTTAAPVVPTTSSIPAAIAAINTTATTTATTSSTPGGAVVTGAADQATSISQVSPEFLAALPPHIQEEVLAQERAEQQRLIVSQQPPATVSAEPVDPAAFIQNLPPGLRQTVLADMDDTVLAVLPSEIAAEAQALRLDRVLRHRQLMQERLLRETGLQGRLGHGVNYYRLSVPRGQSGNMWGWGNPRGSTLRSNPAIVQGSNFQGRQLVDLEALTCLLVLLFVNEPKLNTARLHRVLRNLSYHATTRQWILQALLSILDRTSVCGTPLIEIGNNSSSNSSSNSRTVGEIKTSGENNATLHVLTAGSSTTPSSSGSSVVKSQPSWLSISMEAALGCRANVFQVERGSKKSSSERHGSLVCIHPQAAPLVCRHALDTLVSLAKVFPYQFVPQKAKDASGCGSSDATTAENKSQDTSTSATAASSQQSDVSEPASSQGSSKSSSVSKLDMDFWDLLVRLDSTSLGRKGKAASKPPSASSTTEKDNLSGSGSSPLASLMAMLSHGVIRRSTTLTDRLLHLLSLVSASLPDKDKAEQTAHVARTAARSLRQASTAAAAQQPTTQAAITTAPTQEPTNLSSLESISSQPSAATPVSAAATSGTPSTPAPTETTTQAAALTQIEQAVSPMVEGGSTTSSGGSTNGASPMDTASADAETADTQIVDETSTKESDEKMSSKTQEESKPEKTVVEENLLELAVEVLTAHSCSEDGLEDATTLLMQLSRGHGVTREAVLRLLLAGAQLLGNTLCSDITKLVVEVQTYQSKNSSSSSSNSPDAEEPSTSSASSSSAPSGSANIGGGGTIMDRFNQSASIVITGNTNSRGPGRGGFELRLPSMSLFTSKMSNQNLFLRMLKVVIQLREAARKAAKRATETQRQLTGTANLAAAVAALEAGASELMEMVNRRGDPGPVGSRRAVTPATGETTPDTPQIPPVSTASSTPRSVPVSATSSSLTTPSIEQPPLVATPPVSSISGGTTTTPTSGTASSATVTASSSSAETPMEVDQPSSSSGRVDGAGTPLSAASGSQIQPVAATQQAKETPATEQPRLSTYLGLNELWETLSACLTQLSRTPDNHAVLVLQPAVEAFFLVHASEKDLQKQQPALESQLSTVSHGGVQGNDMTTPVSPMPSTPGSVLTTSMSGFFARESSVTSIVTANMPPDTQKFLLFAETHRDVLNQILRQSTVHLSEGPFSVLVNHTRILDFDVKRRYFRQELERTDEGMRREDMAIHIRREHVFEDSYRELHRRSAEEWKNRFYVVFEGEEGQDAGGLLREWYLIISKEIFNQMYALFKISPGDRVTYIPNPASHCNSNHLSYFKFVGRIIAKAIYDNKLLECYFSRSFYKHILGKHVKYTDMESEDYPFYQGLVFLLEHDVSELGYELTFSTDIEEFGVTEVRDMKPNGRNITVTEATKSEYVSLVCQMKMTGAIRKQIDSFLEGFYDIIPKKLISIFNEQELELLLAGLPTIDVDELKANTEYHKYQSNSLQIQWFWRALRSFDQALRAKFMQFVTGTSKVPLQGFASLEGMNGPQKFQIHRDDRSTDRLPTAHTCFNQLDLPAYETYDKLRKMLLLAIEECTEGFGLA